MSARFRFRVEGFQVEFEGSEAFVGEQIALVRARILGAISHATIQPLERPLDDWPGVIERVNARDDVVSSAPYIEVGAWLHVDGAYGAYFNLCPEGREKLQAMGRADSVVMDPHKTLFLPYGTGALLAAAILLTTASRSLLLFSRAAILVGRHYDEQ